ncbi:MAG: hypothetical protein IKX51_04095 [Bacteroidales bacterium]|nr:hypothetical protein [Bacteroidales bacterium]
MDRTTLAKIYGILSFLFLIGAFVVYFTVPQKIWVIITLMFAVFFRMLMERSSRIAIERENTKLKDDLRRLTHILEYERKNDEEK